MVEKTYFKVKVLTCESRNDKKVNPLISSSKLG